MFSAIFFSLWFFLPAGLATLAAFASGKIGFLKKFNYPVDGYSKVGGKRILGDHKTIRGFLVAILVGILICYFEVFVYSNFFPIRELVPIDYYRINPILLGSLLGFGALFGDSIKSFFKRQINIDPGESWFPFDQIDHIVGGLVFSLFYLQLSVYYYLLICFFWFLIHPLMTFIGFLLKLRKKPL